MSWLFSQALAEVSSVGTSLAGEQFAQLNVMPTPHKFWRNDKTMEFSNLSRFGLTLQLLTEGHGTELLMSYLADFPAKTSAKLTEMPQASAEAVADYGNNLSGLFAMLTPGGSTWKTAQCSLLEDLEPSSVTWQNSGSMLNGACYLRNPLVPPISGIDAGLWPTPCASRISQELSVQKSGDGRTKPNKLGWAVAVRTYPTPCARDYRTPGRSRLERTGQKNGDNQPQVVGGALNPMWVEWLMGWPLGWTDLKPLEMDKYQQWQQLHTAFYANALEYHPGERNDMPELPIQIHLQHGLPDLPGQTPADDSAERGHSLAGSPGSCGRARCSECGTCGSQAIEEPARLEGGWE